MTVTLAHLRRSIQYDFLKAARDIAKDEEGRRPTSELVSAVKDAFEKFVYITDEDVTDAVLREREAMLEALEQDSIYFDDSYSGHQVPEAIKKLRADHIDGKAVREGASSLLPPGCTAADNLVS